jgi:hypothetical protein
MKATLVLLFFSFISFFLFSQAGVSINENGATAHQSAILDVSSTTKGFLAPKMTTLQRMAILNPVAGLLVYDTDIESYFMYRESTPPYTGWREIFAEDFIGIGNLNDAKTDSENVFLGFFSGYNASSPAADQNIGIGIYSLADMVNGSKNVAVGTDALANLNGSNSSTGNQNTAIGSNALFHITTGNNNTAIGHGAGPTIATLNNTVAIGANATPTGNNQIVLGTNTETVIIPGLGLDQGGDVPVIVNEFGVLSRGTTTRSICEESIMKEIAFLKSENQTLKSELSELRSMIEALQNK